MFLDQNDHPRDIVCERYTDFLKKRNLFRESVCNSSIVYT